MRLSKNMYCSFLLQILLHLLVGDDAYIVARQNRPIFTVVYGKFATFLAADVGIGPYTDSAVLRTAS